MSFVLAGAGCGNTHSGSEHSVTAAARAPSPLSPAKVGVDLNIPLRAWWSVAQVARSGDEVFHARLKPPHSESGGESRYVQMTGLGFPYLGSLGGESYAGPGVDQPWDFHNNEYQVSFRFTGQRLGLLVLSTGGQWRVFVDGAAVGGSAPRSAGSSYAHHILDLEFPASTTIRSRTITFELSGGAWLTGIGTGAASDHITPPPHAASELPSVYWLGDSYVVGSGAKYPGFDDLVHVASRQAGVSNVTVDALGGTGYAKSNPAAKFPNYLARARLNLRAGRATPDLIVVGGSINDDVYTTAQVRTAAAALFSYLARAVPKAKIVVIPFTDAYPIPSPVQHPIDGVLAAAHAAPNVIGVLDLPAQVLARRGNQPVERFSSTMSSTRVLYHPSPVAHQLYGQIIGRYIAELLRRRHLDAVARSG